MIDNQLFGSEKKKTALSKAAFFLFSRTVVKVLCL